MLLSILRSIFLCLLISFAAIASENLLDITLQELISEKVGNPQLNCEIYYETQEKVEKIKNKQSEIQTISLVMFDSRSHRFKVRVSYRTGGSEDVFGKYTEFVEVPVLASSIRAGEILKASDISLVRMKASKVTTIYCVEMEEAVGKQLRKSLPKGSLIKKIEVVNPVVIKTNDPVNITYVSAGIMLKTSGIALGSGSIGDMIKVKNGDTGIVVLGQIINKNTVQVGANEE